MSPKRGLVSLGERSITEVDGVELNAREVDALDALFKAAIYPKDKMGIFVHMNLRKKGNYFTIGAVSRGLNRARSTVRQWNRQEWHGGPPPQPSAGTWISETRPIYIYTEEDFIRLYRWMRIHGMTRIGRADSQRLKRNRVRKKKAARKAMSARRVKLVKTVIGE